MFVLSCRPGSKKRISSSALPGAVLGIAGLLACTNATASSEAEAGWYVEGRGLFSSVDDAENQVDDSDSATCSLGLPGFLCLFPPGSGGSAPMTTSVFGDGSGFDLSIGRQFRNGLRLDASLNWLKNDIDSVRDESGSSDASDGELEARSLLLNAWYHFLPGHQFTPYIGAGLGSRQLEISSDGSSIDDTVFGYQVGAGVSWNLSERLALSLDYRYLDGENPHYESKSSDDVVDSEFTAQTIGLSARYLFIHIPPPDSDADGVPDRADKCPGTGSGLPVDADGCPLDGDKDGVFDGNDQCPNSPAGSAVNSKGCPKDSDGDGVTDDQDQCPATPRGTKVNAQGCPADSDNDGVVDAEDECPNSPAGAQVLSNGCESLVLEGVQFETDSDQLREDAQDVLARAAEVLQRRSDVRVEVQGHTDDIGRDGYNLSLSQRRAEAVREDLIQRGVSPDQLTAKGYGESQPLVANSNDANRAQNRRVELKVISD